MDGRRMVHHVSAPPPHRTLRFGCCAGACVARNRSARQRVRKGLTGDGRQGRVLVLFRHSTTRIRSFPCVSVCANSHFANPRIHNPPTSGSGVRRLPMTRTIGERGAVRQTPRRSAEERQRWRRSSRASEPSSCVLLLWCALRLTCFEMPKESAPHHVAPCSRTSPTAAALCCAAREVERKLCRAPHRREHGAGGWLRAGQTSEPSEFPASAPALHQPSSPPSPPSLPPRLTCISRATFLEAQTPKIAL